MNARRRPLRILLAMIEPPLPFGSAAARWFYVLYKGLVARGHRVTAFVACSNPADIAKARGLFPEPRYDLRCYPYPRRSGLASKLETLRRPYSYMFGDDLKRDLRRELDAGYDVLHLEQLWSGWLALELGQVERALVNVHHLTWIDLEHHRPATLRARLDQELMLATERRLVRELRHFRSCSPRLVPEMLAVNPAARISTVPVAIDAGQYPCIPDAGRGGDPVVSVIGTHHWYPTLSASQRLLTRLWPEIKRQVPRARAQIIGWNARQALREFWGMPDVTIEENVPDTRPYFERTGVLLYAPGRGSGMKIKVLEAMAYGVPVVTTSEGVEGLPALDSVHAGIAETDAGLIERAVRLLGDPGLQNRQRAEARRLVETHCAPEAALDQLEAIYEGMLGARPVPEATA